MYKNLHNTLVQILVFGIAALFSACVSTNPKTGNADMHAIVSKANQSFYLDQRIWYQDIQAQIQGQTIVLKGEAFFERPVQGIIKKLRKAGYKHDIIDQVTYLPEQFENDLAYGIITEPYVMGRYKPVSEKHEATEMLYGEPVRLIRDVDPYFQVQSSVGYLGYIPKTALRAVDLQEWNRYQTGKQAVFAHNIRLTKNLNLKMGTRLPYWEGDHLLLANGSEITLSSDQYNIVDPAANPLRKAIIESAKGYLGLPYVWGGRSADGVDCSGFVMQSYSLNNLYLPRDTDEMANVGRIVGLPGWTEAMLPGDLLFFVGSRRLVTHTAIYMGEGKVIHSLGSGVQIQSLNPDDPDYAENLNRRFIFAKRLFE